MDLTLEVELSYEKLDILICDSNESWISEMPEVPWIMLYARDPELVKDTYPQINQD